MFLVLAEVEPLDMDAVVILSLMYSPVTMSEFQYQYYILMMHLRNTDGFVGNSKKKKIVTISLHFVDSQPCMLVLY